MLPSLSMLKVVIADSRLTQLSGKVSSSLTDNLISSSSPEPTEERSSYFRFVVNFCHLYN